MTYGKERVNKELWPLPVVLRVVNFVAEHSLICLNFNAPEPAFRSCESGNGLLAQREMSQ